jgi:hypothetical protein
MSPTALREGPYRFYFLSNEPSRPHVHCQRDDAECKFWLERNGCPEVSIKDPGEFSARELKAIREIIEKNHILLLQVWYRYFGLPFPSYKGCK